MTALTVAASLNRAALDLAAADSPRLDAELLLAHVLQVPRAQLWARPERLLTPDEQASYRGLVTRRIAGEPLPYITGWIEFYGLEFAVDPRVLIPRPETETLIDLALAWQAEAACRVLEVADVGTGSGCIAIALAHAWHAQAHIYALDLSTEALAVARANAERHGVAGRISFVQSDLLLALPCPVDLIVSNPPYVAAGDPLPQPVREHEPCLALDGGADGLDLIRRLLIQAPDYLRPGGAMLIEIGAAQGATVLDLARSAFPQAEVIVHLDLAGLDRVLMVQT